MLVYPIERRMHQPSQPPAKPTSFFSSSSSSSFSSFATCPPPLIFLLHFFSGSVDGGNVAGAARHGGAPPGMPCLHYALHTLTRTLLPVWCWAAAARLRGGSLPASSLSLCVKCSVCLFFMLRCSVGRLPCFISCSISC